MTVAVAEGVTVACLQGRVHLYEGHTPEKVVFGARLNSTPAMGRFMRYEDLRSGPLLERLRVSRDRDAWTFDAEIRDLFAAFASERQ